MGVRALGRDKRRFTRSADSSILSCGARGQNRFAIAALLDCIDQGLPLCARQTGNAIIAAAHGDQPLLFCESSGSTGKARTIRRSHASWIKSFEVNRGLLDIGNADCCAVLGHLGHSLSLYGVIEALHLGADVLALGGDGPRAQIEALHRHKAGVLYATPSQLRLLLRADDTRLGGVRQVICGGGALSEADRTELCAVFPNARIHEFYGASETSFITITDSDTPPGSVGRPYPGVELRLDSAGEIWLRSPYIFDGYDGDGSTDTQWKDGFLTVGEIGWQDDRGHLFLRGRKSRMVTVADVNVFLDDIERVMAETCGVRSCAAISVADPLRGNSVIGVVTGAVDLTLARAAQSHCREKLGPLSAPRKIVFLDPLPMLASGKPDLLKLQRIALDE